MRTIAERRGAGPVRHVSLHLKISIYVAAGLVVIFALLGLLGFYVVNQGTREALNSRLAIARLAAFHLDAELGEQFTTLSGAAAPLGPALVAGAAVTAPDVDTEPFTLAIALVDRQGQLRWGEGQAAALAARLAGGDLLPAALTGQSRVISGVFALADGQPAVALLVPVRSADGGVTGALVEAVDPTNDHFSEFLREASRLGQSGHAELVDSRGLVISATQPERSLAGAEHPDLYSRVFASGQAAVGTSREMENGQAGERHIMAVAPLQSAPWVVAIGGSEQEMLAPARQWQGLLVLAGLISLLTALGLVWVTTQAVARPVRQLTGAAQRIAAGDLGYPVPQGAGAEVGRLALSFDEMRQRLAAALNALTVEKSQYEAAFRSMADALFTVDDRFRIATFNPAAERLTGLSAAEVRGRPCGEVFRPEDGGICAGCALIQLEGADTAADGVQHYLTPGGRRLTVATACSPILGEEGRVVGVVHVMRDVSAREELDRLKDEFISTISHELRTPLGFIKGYATTLLRQDAPVDLRTRRRFLRIIDQASDELEGLVGNLLDMSKIGAGALQLHPSRLDLASLVRRAVTRARRGAREHRFTLSLPRRLPAVQGDARRLEQVLGNLLGNAVKYSPSGSEVAVSVRVEGEAISISVADAGIGLPPGELETVFERFYRSPEAVRRGIGGTGLGLAICRGIVAAHGGRIWAANRPGGGSLFTLTIPVAAANGEVDVS